MWAELDLERVKEEIKSLEFLSSGIPEAIIEIAKNTTPKKGRIAAKSKTKK